MNRTESKQLLEMLRAGIRTASEDLRAKQGVKFDGFALCTDDNLRTVYHVAHSTSDKRYWHEPVEWTLVSKVAKLEFFRISEFLDSRATAAAQAGKLAEHVAECFGALVTSLDNKQSGADHQFGGDVLRLVISTDPSDKLRKLEIIAARRLNEESVFAAWEKARKP